LRPWAARSRRPASGACSADRSSFLPRGPVLDEESAELAEELDVAVDAPKGQREIDRWPSGRGAGREREARQGAGECLGRDGLREIAVHAGGETALFVALHRVSGQGDDGDAAACAGGVGVGAARGRGLGPPADRALPRPDRARGLEAIHLGHLHVHQHDVERAGVERGQRGPAVAHDARIVDRAARASASRPSG
jgi:hypothetical protein